jgi:uncharacterized coiled-coil DUF342 family protein
MKKNTSVIENKEIEELVKKIDELQNDVRNLDNKLSEHIKFIDKVYEPLRSPISKIKNFFN